jgi:DNA-3-methyladenine glycosylase II
MKKAIPHLRSADPAMDALIHRLGPFRMRYKEPDFAALVQSIVSQQLSTKAAATIHGRLREGLGEVTPARILKQDPADLRGWGLSGQKTAYLLDLAEKTRKRQVRFQALPAMSDDEVIEHLTQVKGVGVWTAQMFLMFALRRPDVLPVGDLGIRTAIRNVYALEELPGPGQMEEIARPWRPWASVACWYLWRSLEGPAEL